MKNIFANVPESIKGAISVAAGFVLLFHTFDILKEFLNYILMFIALYLIVVGFIRMGGVDWIKKLTPKKQNKQEGPGPQ